MQHTIKMKMAIDLGEICTYFHSWKGCMEFTYIFTHWGFGVWQTSLVVSLAVRLIVLLNKERKELLLLELGAPNF